MHIPQDPGFNTFALDDLALVCVSEPVCYQAWDLSVWRVARLKVL